MGGASAKLCGQYSNERWIFSDQAYIDRIKPSGGKGDLPRYFVLAHEAAHHVNGDKLYLGNTWTKDQELASRLLAAVWLTRLGVDRDELLKTFDALGLPVESVNGYPTLEERRAKVIEGIFAASLAREDSPRTTRQLNLVAELSTIDCPVDQNGDINPEPAQNGVILCLLTGIHLNGISQLRLRNATNVTDPKTVEGAVTTSPQSKKTTVAFQERELCALPTREYKVYLVAPEGEESGGQNILHFNSQLCLSNDRNRSLSEGLLRYVSLAEAGFAADGIELAGRVDTRSESAGSKALRRARDGY